MNVVACIVLAVLSIWDYPARHQTHDALRNQFIIALREGDTETMIETCRKGVQLLPDDPTWHYNLACSLAYMRRPDESLDELEKAIDLGFRDADLIAKDSDLKRISGERRFKELVEYAREMRTKPILSGPMASVDATGVFGRSIALGAQNFSWNFDFGCFIAKLKLASNGSGGNLGDLYMNRDHFHSPNGREALDILNDPEVPPFDFVLTDLFMPEMNGDELIAAIRADPALESLIVYLFTAEVEMKDTYAEKGFSGILLKPANLESLKKLLP